MIIKTLSDIPKIKADLTGAAGVWKQLPIGSMDGSPHFSLRVFTVEIGGNTPHHSHPYEHVNYVISGCGELVDEEGKGHPLSAGDFALVQPDEVHQYRNTSDSEALVLICGVPREFE